MRRLLVSLVVAGFAVPGMAHAVTSTQKIPLTIEVTACNGDTIQLSGSLLTVSSATVMAGGGFVFSFHSQPQGVGGADLQTGTRYRGVGVTRETAFFFPGGGFTDTFVNQFRIQATGGAQSFVITQLFHATVNANGQIAVIVDRVSLSC
jgi:hypothetical protein